MIRGQNNLIFPRNVTFFGGETLILRFNSMYSVINYCAWSSFKSPQQQALR